MAFVAVQLIKVLLLMSLTNLDSALKSPVPTGRISPQRCATGDDSTDANPSTSEESSSLITLLNFAQEVGAGSSSDKLRSSADRLRQQFVKSFTMRYNLSTGPLAGGVIASGSLPTLLSNINDDSLLKEEAKALKDVILMQLGEVGRETVNQQLNILYYNEKLKYLSEYRYVLPFPRDTLQPFTLADSSQTHSSDAVKDAIPKVSGSDIMTAIKEKKLREAKEKIEVAQEAEAEERLSQTRPRKRDLFLKGIRSVGSIFRQKTSDVADDEKTAGIDDDNANSDPMSNKERDMLVQGFLHGDSDDKSHGRYSMSRQEQVAAANIENTLRRAKRQRLKNNPDLLEQQKRDIINLTSALGEEVHRWRNEAAKAVEDAVERAGALTVPSKRNYAISKPLSEQKTIQEHEKLQNQGDHRRKDAQGNQNSETGEEPTYASWRASMETISAARSIFPIPRRLIYSEIPSTAFTVQREGTSHQQKVLRTELLSECHPNYVALLHSCITASLATYNLELSSVFQSMEAFIDTNLSQMRKQVRQYQRSLEEEDESFLTSLSAQTASAIHDALTLNTTNDDDILASKNNLLGLKRARLLSRVAIGSISQTEIKKTITADMNNTSGALSYHVLSKTRECGEDGVDIQTVRSDKACGIITTDPVQSVTIVAFRGTLDPVDVVTDISFASAPFKTINDRLLRDFRDSEELIPEFESIEAHSGFLQSFLSVVDQIESCLEEVASAIRGSDESSNKKHTLVFTGHSMGGALAQLAAAYFCDYEDFKKIFDTNLVTIAAPATGNSDFSKYLDANVGPHGGIRLWNEYDPVPYLATVVGYEHCGIPIKVPLHKAASKRFKSSTKNPFVVAGGFDSVMPHVLYQLGSILYAFPVLGYNINDSASSSDGEGMSVESPDI